MESKLNVVNASDLLEKSHMLCLQIFRSLTNCEYEVIDQVMKVELVRRAMQLATSIRQATDESLSAFQLVNECYQIKSCLLELTTSILLAYETSMLTSDFCITVELQLEQMDTKLNMMINELNIAIQTMKFD